MKKAVPAVSLCTASMTLQDRLGEILIGFTGLVWLILNARRFRQRRRKGKFRR